MKAMVLAAGLGTRLRPLTDLLPKPLIPVGNRPLISWILDELVQFGVDEIVVNIHHHPERLENFLREEYGHRVSLDLSFEDEILGTGGGLMRVREHFEGKKTFLLVNGDTIHHPLLGPLVEAREENDAIAALMLRHPPPGDRFTTVGFENGFVTGFGGGAGESLMFSGSHAISPRLFDHLPPEGFSAIVSEGYMRILDAGVEKIAAVVDDGFWFDVGTPERYLAASRALRERLVAGEADLHGSEIAGDGSVVFPSARIDGEAVRSTIGGNAVIESGARVDDSVLWEGTTVGRGAAVAGSVLATGVVLPAGSVARNVVVCPADHVNCIPGAKRVGDWTVLAATPSGSSEFEVGRG